MSTLFFLLAFSVLAEPSVKVPLHLTIQPCADVWPFWQSQEVPAFKELFMLRYQEKNERDVYLKHKGTKAFAILNLKTLALEKLKDVRVVKKWTVPFGMSYLICEKTSDISPMLGSRWDNEIRLGARDICLLITVDPETEEHRLLSLAVSLETGKIFGAMEPNEFASEYRFDVMDEKRCRLLEKPIGEVETE